MSSSSHCWLLSQGQNEWRSPKMMKMRMSLIPLYSGREKPKCVGEPGFEERWLILDDDGNLITIRQWASSTESVQGWLWTGDRVASSEEGRSLAKGCPAWEGRRCWCWLVIRMMVIEGGDGDELIEHGDYCAVMIILIIATRISKMIGNGVNRWFDNNKEPSAKILPVK